MRGAKFVALILLAMAFVAASAKASQIVYGNFGPNTSGDTFINVTESSGTDAVPLYGPPTVTPAGLDFNPASFVASSTGANSDVTDGQLNFSVKSATGINELSLFEGGDYSLTGIGPAQAAVAAGLSMRLTITEIDNAPVAPINVPVSTNSFSANSPPNAFAPWNLGLLETLNSSLAGIPHVIGATRVDVAIDNDLTAISTANSAAFIGKKEFQLAVNSDISRILPEPGSLALLGIASCGLFGRRRRA